MTFRLKYPLTNARAHLYLCVCFHVVQKNWVVFSLSVTTGNDFPELLSAVTLIDICKNLAKQFRNVVQILILQLTLGAGRCTPGKC